MPASAFRYPLYIIDDRKPERFPVSRPVDKLAITGKLELAVETA
jgi:hypothetical protein